MPTSGLLCRSSEHQPTSSRAGGPSPRIESRLAYACAETCWLSSRIPTTSRSVWGHAGEVRGGRLRGVAADRDPRRRRPLSSLSARPSGASRRRWRSAAFAKRSCGRAAAELGVGDVTAARLPRQYLDRAEPHHAIAAIAGHLRRVRPDVVITFGPDGAYGHPDHIAISQFTSAAIVTAADPMFASEATHGTRPHAVAKLYYIAWPQSTWAAYQVGIQEADVDGRRRRAPDRPMARLGDHDADRHAELLADRVAGGLAVIESQMAAYEKLSQLSPELHEALWGSQSFYRVVQHRKRRTKRRKPICSKGSDDG